MLIPVLIAAAIVILVSLVGVVTTWGTIGEWMTRNLHYLISFSAGVFLIVALDLVGEVIVLTTLTNTLILLGFGALIFFVFGRIVLGAHEHHDPSGHERVRSRQRSRQIIVADGLHNITDGIILVPAFASSVELGIAVTVGIVFHELVQEISEFFVLRDAGYSTRRALVLSMLASLTIFIGVILGFLLTRAGDIEIALLGLAAGGFFYVVFADLAPHSFEQCKDRHSIITHIVSALLGVLIMIGMGIITNI